MLPSTVRYGEVKNGTYSIKDYIKYKYDSMGNICEVLENGLTVARYEYDMLGRLIREDNRKFAITSIYTYDNNGNILSRLEYNLTNVQTNELKLTIPREMFVYEYDGDNTDKLICYAGAGFTYDSIGNPTTYRGRAVTWINGRQLASYDGNTYTYDARGRRISKRKGNNTAINFTYDSNGNLVSQSNGMEFLYDHTGVFAVIFNGTTYFYIKNAQGDIIAILDNEGRVVVKYTYDAWGNTVIEVLDCNANAIAELNPFRYRGYYYDIETELYFLKSRYYYPELGRFMTIDDVSYLDPDTINGLNLYAYCVNNPIMRIDTSGNFGNWIIGSITWVNNKIVQPISQFISDIKEDINNYDKFNNSPKVVIDSNYFSSYNGKLVIRTNTKRSASIGILLISYNENSASDWFETVQHEYGHTKQLEQMGLINYLILIGLPSWQMWGPEYYYHNPWEITADIYGGVNLSNRNKMPTQRHIDNGNYYMEIASSDMSIFKKIMLLKVYY